MEEDLWADPIKGGMTPYRVCQNEEGKEENMLLSFILMAHVRTKIT